jgi:hypothetical protein
MISAFLLTPTMYLLFESIKTPWNTVCVWNHEKLSLIGLTSISDLGKLAAVEECVAIPLLQKLFPKSVAKHIKVEDISWEETLNFADEERQKWHVEKMKSKVGRPAHELNRLELSRTVLYC